jgi:S-adenosylmethionine-dependent methyltransferase
LSTGFTTGEQQWRAGRGTLRDVVRQELVARQLAAHLPAPPARILDVGCGQGTQILRLARHGHHVTGLDASAALLADLDAALAAEPAGVRDRVVTVRGDALDAAALLAPQTFDAVLCHGVLMYVRDPMPLLGQLARLIAPGGLLSLLVRNGNGLALRPGLLGDWAAARRAFDDDSYDNRIGVTARADRTEELAALLGGRRLALRAWYGVRVFTDLAPGDAPVPGAAQLAELLACEERAGATDPYRRVAALTHLIADRGPA